MSQANILKLFIYICFFILPNTSYSADPVCSLPENSCVGIGCAFKQRLSTPLSTQVSQMPVLVMLPPNACATGSPSVKMFKIPANTIADFEPVGFDGSTSLSYYNVSLNTRADRLPMTLNMSYLAWLAVYPPNCTYVGGSVAPGTTVFTWPAPTGFPAEGTGCSMVTSVCSGNSTTASWSVAPEAYLSCNDSCRGPDGTILAIGAAKDYYTAATAPDCSLIRQNRVCQASGNLTGTATFATCVSTCPVASPGIWDCSTFNTGIWGI